MVQDPICGMAVDPSKARSLLFDGTELFFCSERCLDKFSKKHHIPEPERQAKHVKTKQPVYQNKTFIVSVILLGLMGFSYAIPFLIPFRESFLEYLKIIWWAVLLGLFLGGVIDQYVPTEYISNILSKRQKKTIIHSVILGFFMSACSHGILALAMQFHKKGASTSSVIAFLLASPWANLTLTIVLVGLFGVKALFIIVAAIVIALVTGLIYQVLEARGWVEKNTNTVEVQESFSIKEDIQKRLKQSSFSFEQFAEGARGIWKGMAALGNMVLWWILIGMGIASFAGAYIPTDFFQNYMGPTLLGLLVTLALATVIEVCSEGSAPMAFEIFRQTGALGNSFVFLMAGVATDYTEIGLLWHNVGKKAAIWLPIITVPQVILFGMLANLLF